MVVVDDYNKSTGCKAEIKFCKENNIPIIFFKDSDELSKNLKKIL